MSHPICDRCEGKNAADLATGKCWQPDCPGKPLVKQPPAEPKPPRAPADDVWDLLKAVAIPYVPGELLTPDRVVAIENVRTVLKAVGIKPE